MARLGDGRVAPVRTGAAQPEAVPNPTETGLISQTSTVMAKHGRTEKIISVSLSYRSLLESVIANYYEDDY